MKLVISLTHVFNGKLKSVFEYYRIEMKPIKIEKETIKIEKETSKMEEETAKIEEIEMKKKT